MTAIRFEVTPTFPEISWSDDDDLKEAVEMVLKARSRRDEDGQVIQALRRIGLLTIGDLRRLSDQDWRELEVPAICRIYLKYLIRQSGRRRLEPKKRRDSFITKLEQDFNSGKPLDMARYESNIAKLSSMGFSRNEALEALCISGNKVQDAIEVCILPADRRAQRRLEAMMHVTPSETTPSYEAVKPSKPEDSKQKLVMLIYKGFILGVIASGEVTPIDMEKLKKYQEENGIGDKEQLEVLSEIGVSLEQFEQMKVYEMKREKECVVCLERPKDYVIFNCMHLCLCEVCAQTYMQKKSPKCPMCSKKAAKIVKIFI